MKASLRGYADILVYADDFVCCFEYPEDAEKPHVRFCRRACFIRGKSTRPNRNQTMTNHVLQTEKLHDMVIVK